MIAPGPSPPRVAVFGPDSLLCVTIEAGGTADDLHVHAAGQGVWVARAAAELGATPVLCTLLGGETGRALLPMLEQFPGERRIVWTAGSSGGYVIDRRAGERDIVATSLRPSPHRHELDDLVSATVAAALGANLLVMCNPYPVEGVPDEVYETIGKDARAAGIPLLVDLSSPRLDRALRARPDLVKLNDWELAEYVRGPVDGPGMLEAAQSLREAGARAVVVTRAEQPILVVCGDEEPFEVVPPPFPNGFREGCGDTMMGAIAAALARRRPLRDAVVLGAAAGSVNFLRHGLGTGARATIEELAARVAVRPLLKTAAGARPRG
jgi:1-phosphofructokinase